MAQKITPVILVSDLSGTEGAETVPFTYAGTRYTIDLTTKERATFDKALAPFISKAHEVGGSDSKAQAIREWARGKGVKVAERGRLPHDVKTAYEAEMTAAGVES